MDKILLDNLEKIKLKLKENYNIIITCEGTERIGMSNGI